MQIDRFTVRKTAARAVARAALLGGERSPRRQRRPRKTIGAPEPSADPGHAAVPWKGRLQLLGGALVERGESPALSFVSACLGICFSLGLPCFPQLRVFILLQGLPFQLQSQGRPERRWLRLSAAGRAHPVGKEVVSANPPASLPEAGFASHAVAVA